MSDTLEDLKAELRSLTVEQLAERLASSQWRIFQMIKKGEAPPNFKVEKTYRFPVAGVWKWFRRMEWACVRSCARLFVETP